MQNDDAILAAADAYLGEHVGPNAAEIDLCPDALGKALDGLGKRNLLALRRPLKYGGPDLGDSAFRTFQESVARWSGSLAFLQTQHQSAVSMIARGDNEGIKDRCLPKMGNGELLMGIGFSQLRRPGPPLLRAEACSGGFLIDGHIPWITGLGFFSEVLIGAALPDGSAVFGIIPLQDVESPGSAIKLSPPMRLAAMESAQTVTADLRSWILKDSDVAFIKPPGWIHANDQINITLQGFFALGCARGGLDVLLKAHHKRSAAFLLDAWNKLDEELSQCREAMVVAQRLSGEETTDEKLQLRAWAIELAARCTHAAVASSGGAANDIRNSAQRLYREALVYTVSAQTSPIMEATLKRLVRRAGR